MVQTLIFDHFTVIAVLFCVRLLNFLQIWPPRTVIWRHIDFSKWRPRQLTNISVFAFVDVTAFRRSKFISKPNFVDISISRYLYFRFGKKRPPYWNSTSGFIFHHFIIIGVLFCVRLPNFVQIEPCTQRGNMTSYRFSRWRPSEMLYLLWDNGGPPTKCLSWSEFWPQIASSSG